VFSRSSQSATFAKSNMRGMLVVSIACPTIPGHLSRVAFLLPSAHVGTFIGSRASSPSPWPDLFLRRACRLHTDWRRSSIEQRSGLCSGKGSGRRQCSVQDGEVNQTQTCVNSMLAEEHADVIFDALNFESEQYRDFSIRVAFSEQS